MAAQKVKVYLEKHKIGALFEDLMAKVIKDMPNEPLSFLIDSLQQMYKKKHPDKVRPQSPSRYPIGFGLTGVPAPKRSEREPQSILPGGGKTISNTWTSHDIERLKSNRVSFDESSKRREYEKPWQSGARYNKLREDHEFRQSLKNDVNRERPGWNQDTKVPSHDFDEWMKQSEDIRLKSSLSEGKRKERKPYYVGVKSWADTAASADFRTSKYEDGILRQPVAHRREKYISNDDLDFAYPIRKKTVSFEDLSTTTTDSESSVSTVKGNKLSAKEQALGRKKELQNFLIGRSSLEMKERSPTEESSDEADEVYESADELQDEGATCRAHQGTKFSKKHRRRSCLDDDIKVKICGRCARLMAGDEASTIVGTFKSDAGTYVWDNRKSYTDGANSIVTADYDFESVSQIGKNGKKLPAWPIISDTEGDMVTSRPSPRMKGSSMLSAKSTARSGSHHSVRSADEASTVSRNKLDHDHLFSGDPRVYQRHRAKKAGYLTDTETEIGAKSAISVHSGFQLHGRHGWSVRSVGTDSEADAEDSDPSAGAFNRRGNRNARSFLK